MNPTFLDNMSWEMAEVYGAITDQILINLSRYFPYMKAGNVPKSAFTYQAAMLAQMGQVNKDTINIIRNNLQGVDKTLGKVLEQAIIDAVSKAEPGLLKAVKAGILKPAGIPIVAPNQMRAYNLYYQQAAQKLNLVNTVMLESTKQAYQATVSDVVSRIQATQNALDIGAGETLTGVSSWNQAMRHAIDRMKDNGITGFIDHGGHRWSAEAYTAMDIRTTVANTARAAVWETNQDFGNDLYIVSYHDGARPLCYPWQNKVISSTNNARTVKDLDGNEIQVYAQSDTSYGEAAGLFGINCKHYPSPFIPGVSVLYDQSNIPDEKENEKIYEQTQEQRALERKLREEKRDLLIEKARGADAETIKALREKCRQTSDDIDAFCEETGLPRRQNREGVFTQRDFPAADTYDVDAFERKQKDEIDKFFSGGGSQTGYTFGEMTPKEQQPESSYKSVSTLKEAEEYARQHFAKRVTYEGMTVDTANEVNRTLQELHEKYPTRPLVRIDKRAFRGKSTAWANGGELLTAGKHLGEFEGYDWAAEKVGYEAQVEAFKFLYADGKMPASVKKTMREYERLAKFDLWNFGTGSVRDTIIHEYGHIIADQYIGQFNGKRYCPRYSYEAIKLKTLISQTRKEMRSSGEIFSGMSAYGDTDYYEFFAEAFSGYYLGKSLPQKLIDMVEKVLAFGRL